MWGLMSFGSSDFVDTVAATVLARARASAAGITAVGGVATGEDKDDAAGFLDTERCSAKRAAAVAECAKGGWEEASFFSASVGCRP